MLRLGYDCRSSRRSKASGLASRADSADISRRYTSYPRPRAGALFSRFAYYIPNIVALRILDKSLCEIRRIGV